MRIKEDGILGLGCGIKIQKKRRRKTCIEGKYGKIKKNFKSKRKKQNKSLNPWQMEANSKSIKGDKILHSSLSGNHPKAPVKDEKQVYSYRMKSEKKSTENKKLITFRRDLQRHPLLWILLGFRNQDRVLGLIDPGSSVNIISKQLVKQNNQEFIGKEKIRLEGVNGGQELEVEWYKIKMQLDNIEVDVEILVMVKEILGIPVLLGMPFLVQVNAIIDINRRLLWTQYGTLKLQVQNVDHKSTMINLINTNQINVSRLTSDQLAILNEKIQTAVISLEGKGRIRNTFIKYKKVWIGNGVGQAQGIEMKIETIDEIPVVVPTRHIPLKYQKSLEEYIQKMLEDGVIIPSISPYRTYPVIIPKKTGDLRVCVDYRALNKKTIADQSPLPRTVDLLQATEGSLYYILLDLRSGYWQIPLELWSRKKTAFATHRGLYEFLVVPFGIRNAPGFFQRWVDGILGHLRYKGVIIYIDDILIHAPTEGQLLKLFEESMQCLQNAGAQVNIEKASICPKKIRFLGHILENGTRTPDPERVETLKQIKRPGTIRDVRGLVGMLMYYQSYVKNFSMRIKIVTDLLKGHGRVTKHRSRFVKIQWTKEMDNACNSIIMDLKGAILRNVNWEDSFVIETDASIKGVGAVLYCQKEYYQILQESNGTRRALPICFMSHKFNPTESNWSTPEQEAFAMLWALEKSDPWIRGREVIIRSDHKNLQKLALFTNAKTGKLARWASRLAEYNIVVEHISGHENKVADYLSRVHGEDLLLKDTMSCYFTTAKAGHCLRPTRKWKIRNNTKYKRRQTNIFNNNRSEGSYLALQEILVPDGQAGIREFIDEMVKQIYRTLTKDEFRRMIQWLYQQRGITNLLGDGDIRWNKDDMDAIQGIGVFLNRAEMAEDSSDESVWIDVENDSDAELIIEQGQEGAIGSKKRNLVTPDIAIHAESLLPFDSILQYELPSLDEIAKLQKIERTIMDVGAAWSLKLGIVYYRHRVWVPPSLRNKVLDTTHLGMQFFHASTSQMERIIYRQYNWKGLAQDIRRYLRACATCQRAKPYINKRELKTRFHPVKGPNEVLYIDFWGPIAWGEEKFEFLTMIDYHTKWAEVAIVPNRSVPMVTKTLFCSWFIQRGVPLTIVSDNDGAFRSEGFRYFCVQFGITRALITAYHPEGNAPIESFHRTLKYRLQKIHMIFNKSISIEVAIAWALLNYRALPHEPHLQSPFYLSYSYEMNILGCKYPLGNMETWATQRQLLLSIRQDILERTQWMRSRAILTQDQNDKDSFQLGELVIVKLTQSQLQYLSKMLNGKKLTSVWSLPMRVEHINTSKKGANVRCIATGLVMRVYINRCHKLELPFTEGLKEEWQRMFDSESKILKYLIKTPMEGKRVQRLQKELLEGNEVLRGEIRNDDEKVDIHEEGGGRGKRPRYI